MPTSVCRGRRPRRARAPPRQPPGRQPRVRRRTGDDAHGLCRAGPYGHHRRRHGRTLPGDRRRPPCPWGAPVHVPAGAVLDAGPATHGLRSHLAFAGGVDTEPVLGSRAADLLSGLGPDPLTEGAVLPLGAPYGPAATADAVPHPGPVTELLLPFLPGPRDAWFTAAGLHTLATGRFRVSPASNRIGLRTEGPPLERARTGELPSEGMPLGALQVPPDGLPVLFLHDHPTTGGYPVIGVVPERYLAPAAQAAPGTPVRFLRMR